MKIKYTKVKPILLILVQIFIAWQILSIQNNVYMGMFEHPNTFNNHKILIRTSYTDRTGHPIFIDDSPPYITGSITWDDAATNADWCSGSGTKIDPYVIDNVYMDGQGSDTCISIRDSNANFTIENCYLINGSYGISLRNVSNGILDNNTCSFNGDGIRIWDSNNLEINNNLVYNNTWDGMSLYGTVSHSLFNDNNVMYNQYGIAASWNINNNSITYNNIRYNKGYGIQISGDENDILLNYVNNNEGDGIHCSGDTNYISSNDANNNEGYGIYAGFNSTITYNTANFNSESGIYVYSSNCSINHNFAYDNKIAGIYLASGGHILSDNELDGCGLYIAHSTLSVMSSYSIDTSNDVNGYDIFYKVNEKDLDDTDFMNAAQIFLVNCSNSIIRDFEFSNVSSGISIHFSDNNIISENHLNYNSMQGIYIDGNNNTITDNDIRNGGSPHSDGSIYVKGNNCSILRNNVTNGGGIYYSISIDGNLNNVSENIINYGNGMSIYGINVTVIGNTISYCNSEGITIGTSNSELLSNIINNCLGNGINLYGANDNTIVGNSINNNLDGIYLSFSSEYNNISQNILKNNKDYGIYMSTRSYYEHNNTIVENKMYGCGFGIEPLSLNNLITNDTIDSTNLVNDKPLYLYYHGVNLDENNFTNAGQIILIDCSNSIINNLNCNNGSVGITMYYCNGNEISDVTSENNNLYGIYLYYTDNTIISNSNLNFNTERGIYMDNCEKGIITENAINNNEIDGLFMSSGLDNNYTGNQFEQNQFGITLEYDCTENYFEMNTIHNNTDYGLRILLTSSDYNEFYDNSFINPAGINACDNGSGNGYYYNNYWHDYPGKDADDDGIGDTPYNITGSANSEDIAPIWWDPPVLSVHTPLEAGRYRNAPFYNITINEGIADSIWYTVNNTEKIFITQLSGSIEQSAWNSLSDGNIKITFFVNDSRGFITFEEVNVIKTSAAEFPVALIIIITVISIGAAFGIAVVFLYLKRRKGSGN